MDTPLKNIFARIGMIKNVRTVIRRATNKLLDGRNKKTKKEEENKRQMTLNTYYQIIYFLGMTYLHKEVKQSTRK